MTDTSIPKEMQLTESITMRFGSYSSYATDVYVTEGGHIRIQQYNVDGAEKRDSTYVLLTPHQAELIAANLRQFLEHAESIKYEREWLLMDDEEHQ